jgi:RNA polymerase sigma-70 factor (ECF subfamily)
MLLQESRRAARTSPTGELILLENQDRSLWNREQIAEGVALLEKALNSRRFGSLHTAGCDCGRSCGGGIGRCDRLAADCCALRPIGTNSAFAGCLSIAPWPLPCAMVQRPVWRISTRCWHMANWQITTWRIQPAPICTAGSAGRAEARSAYEKALALTQQEPERQFLQERIRQLK